MGRIGWSTDVASQRNQYLDAAVGRVARFFNLLIDEGEGKLVFFSKYQTLSFICFPS